MNTKELEKRCNELFFQVNEKTERIAELEEENADLKEEVNKIAFARGNLEEENAELKKQLEMSNKVYNDNLDYSHHIEEQFTKAKELLKQWLQISKASGCDNINIVSDTEQFLNEVEK